MEQKFAVGNLIYEKSLGIACISVLVVDTWWKSKARHCLFFQIQWMLIMIRLPLEIFEEKTRSFD